MGVVSLKSKLQFRCDRGDLAIKMVLTNEIDDDDWVVAVFLGFAGIVVLFTKEERSDVRGEDCRVHNQDQDYPVPYRFEW